MKKWLSTIVFIFCLLFSYPLLNWLSKIPGLNKSAFDIVVVIYIAVYIWYIASSIYEMKHGEAGRLLLQAALTETLILLVQIFLLLVVSIVSLMNLVGAFFALPIAYLIIGCFNCLIGFAGTLRGISGIVVACRSGKLSIAAGIVNGLLQFVPFINIIDSIALKAIIKNAD